MERTHSNVAPLLPVTSQGDELKCLLCWKEKVKKMKFEKRLWEGWVNWWFVWPLETAPSYGYDGVGLSTSHLLLEKLLPLQAPSNRPLCWWFSHRTCSLPLPSSSLHNLQLFENDLSYVLVVLVSGCIASCLTCPQCKMSLWPGSYVHQCKGKCHRHYNRRPQ